MVWTGSIDLPVIQDLRPLGDLMVVLLGENGRVFRYDPIVDQLDQLARLSPDAVFGDRTVSAVAMIDSDNQVVHEFTVDNATEFPVNGPVVWASPVDGGLAVLTDTDPPRLILTRRTDAEVVLDVESGGRTALVTAWGQRVVLVGPDGHSLQIYAADDGSLVGEADVGGSVRALTASPSSHEVYASIDDPPRLVVVNRFSLSVREFEVSTDPIEELRPGLFGGSLVVRTADGIGQIESGNEVLRQLSGTWRSDLPLGLSSDRAIVLDDDEAHLLTPGSVAGTVLSGGAPAWWVPLRWNPAVVIVMDQPVEITPPEAQTDAGAAQNSEADSPTNLNSETGRAGHYAIVVSARQRSGVADLLASLAEAGYPTRLQQFPDEAGSTWFRGLVGPYPTRGRAQAAARQLQREHGLQAWVTELGGTR